jgi:hypothetical protein
MADRRDSFNAFSCKACAKTVRNGDQGKQWRQFFTPFSSSLSPCYPSFSQPQRCAYFFSFQVEKDLKGRCYPADKQKNNHTKQLLIPFPFFQEQGHHLFHPEWVFGGDIWLTGEIPSPHFPARPAPKRFGMGTKASSGGSFSHLFLPLFPSFSLPSLKQ